MNRHTRTFAAVALALGTFSAAPLSHAADAPPTTPATVTANRWSGTGADVIWARSTDDKGAVRGYEVFRNGVSLGIRDALSVSEKSLVPGRRYDYSIAAVDSAGQRSAPIRITLDTKGFSNAAAAPSSATVTAPASPSPAVPPPSVRPTAGAPTAPAGLRSTAYSGTAGEIAWTRPSAPGLRYEVRRDGAILKVTDGVSYYDGALSPGRDYRYDVVAIDRDGRRSAAASVALRSQGTAPAGERPNPFAPVSPTAPAPTTPTAPVAPTPAPVASAPAAPSGLRGELYSARAAEIFWQRPSTLGLRYEVSRDGQALKVTDGVSYFDNALPGGTSVDYAVVAVDAQGRRSTPATVRLDVRDGSAAFVQPDPAGASVLARLGYERARRIADDIVSARYLSLYTDIAPAVRAFADGKGWNGPQNVACPGGGSASIERTASGDTGTDPSRFNGGNEATRILANGCRIADRTLTGQVFLSSLAYDFGSTHAIGLGAERGPLTIDAGTRGKLIVNGFVSETVIDDRPNFGSESEACAALGRVQQTVDIENATLTDADGTFGIGPSRIESKVSRSERTPDGVQTDFCYRYREVAFETLGPNPAGRVPETGGPVIVQVTSPRLGGTATFSKEGLSRRDERTAARGGLGNTHGAGLDASFGDGSTLRTRATSATSSSVTATAGGVTASFSDGYAIGVEPLTVPK